MLLNRTSQDRFDRLTDELRLASAITRPIFQAVENVCTRLPAMREAGLTTRLDRLIEAGAWHDAALALVELELPTWKFRRLVCEDGQWFSSLSKHPELPAALDDTADASHEGLALAILGALVEALRKSAGASVDSSNVAPQVRPAGSAICCENFA